MTWGIWIYRVYLFMEVAGIGNGLSVACGTMPESDSERGMFNRLQYSDNGSQPATIAAANCPMTAAIYAAWRNAFETNAITGLYYCLDAETGLLLESNSQNVEIGTPLSFAEAVADVGLTRISATATYDSQQCDSGFAVASPITDGGNGGQFYLVTTLADSGAGSLREACTAQGRRFVDVRVNGTINLQSAIDCSPDLTLNVDAPYALCVRGAAFRTQGDTIIQNVRFRNGVPTHDPQVTDCLSIGGDHTHLLNCSLTWGADSNLEILGTDVLVEGCLIAEALESYNNKGINITQGGGNVTLLRCLIATNQDRNPTFFSGERVDILNCIIANYSSHIHFQPRDSVIELNLINNLFIPLTFPNNARQYVVGYVNDLSNPNPPAFVSGSGQYLEGNVNNHLSSAYAQMDLIQPDVGEIVIAVREAPYRQLHIDITQLLEVDETFETTVLGGAGAFPRDACDTRIVDYVASRNGSLYIEHQDEVGGYPEL